MFTQLNPPIPLHVLGKGDGYALAVIDYGQEHNLIWVTAIDDTGDAVIGSRLHLSDHEVEVLHEIRAGWVDQALEIQLDPELVRERHMFVKQRRAVRQLVWRHVSENRSDDFSARRSGRVPHGSDGGGRRRRRRSGSATRCDNTGSTRTEQPEGFPATEPFANNRHLSFLLHEPLVW